MIRVAGEAPQMSRSRERRVVASMREIARRADFSPAALYKYFDSKDDVIKALADAAMAALVAAFAAVPADLPPDRRAVELGMAYLAFARENPEDVAVIEMHESTAHPHPLTTEHLALEGAVVGVFRDGHRGGRLHRRRHRTPTSWPTARGRSSRASRASSASSARRWRTRCAPASASCSRIYVNGLKTDWSAEG